MFRTGIALAALMLPLTVGLTACPTPPGAGEGEGEGAAGEGEGANTGEGEGEGANTGEGEGEGANTGEGEGEGAGEGEGEGAGGAFSCTTGQIIAGDPNDQNPQLRPSDGDGLLPPAAPFPYRTVVFSGTHMITHDGLTIRTADLSQATPTLTTIAGSEATDASSSGPDQGLIHGACGQARFANIAGIALESDGTLVVSDQTANAILTITSPLDPTNCAVNFLAGTQHDIAVGGVDASNIPQDHLTQTIGSPTDGPVATADMGLPEEVVVDASNNIFFIDGGNDALREISGGNVTTLAKSVDDGFTIDGLTVRNGKVAMFVNLFSALAITEVDPAAAAPATLNCHTDSFTPTGGTCPANSLDDGSGNCNCSNGFANDGTGACLASPCHDVINGGADLFGVDTLDLEGMVGVTAGYVVNLDGALFFVNENGTVNQTPVAGVPSVGLDFTPDYGDPLAQHAAAAIEIPFGDDSATSGQLAFLAIDANNDLYVSALVTNSYLLKINCQ